jgi:hypothetical protein
MFSPRRHKGHKVSVRIFVVAKFELLELLVEKINHENTKIKKHEILSFGIFSCFYSFVLSC